MSLKLTWSTSLKNNIIKKQNLAVTYHISHWDDRHEIVNSLRSIIIYSSD